MNATCTECGSVFRVDPARVPADGVRARCSVCGGVFAVAPDTARSQPTPVLPVAPHGESGPEPMDSVAAPVASIWGAPDAIPAIRHAPVGEAADGERSESVGGANGEERAALAPVAPQGTPVDVADPLAAPPLDVEVSPPRETAAPEVPARPVEVLAPVAPPSAAGPRRPVNPYLTNDPGARARRLARALVSDLVAYQPAKREEGLRDGTLKQLFREEIRKSWDEYVEQIGAPVAEGTTHFQDALNDILAGGRKVF